jgi:hypothetical protein
MNNITYLFLFAITLFLLGCTAQRQSKFTSESIKQSMNKDAVIALYGKPYKESSTIESNLTLCEKLYYKEILFLGRWYEVNTILHLENSVLKSIEQGEEQLLYKDQQIIVK